MQRSILRKLQIYMISFGIFMGIVFPIYANFFVHWKDGMFIYFVIGCIFAGITVGIVSYLFVRIILLKPLLKVSDLAKGIKGKDITGKIDLISYDTVGDIVNGLNAAVKNLRVFICEIEKVTGLIEKITTDYSANESARSYLTNINRSIEVVNHATKNISELSDDIIKSVNEGKETIQQSQHNLTDTAKGVNNLSQLISSMVSHSGKVQSVIELINELATRTNMLALNASIEAAKAGEHGKSFSIVADEVRKLAQSVAISVLDITHTIQLIQNDIDSSMHFIEEIGKYVNENNGDSKALQNKFFEIENITYSNQSANIELISAVTTLNNSFEEIQKAFIALSENIEELHEVVGAYQH